MRFRLRTLLILSALLPPTIAGLVQYGHWRDERLWLSLQTAKRERDEALLAWRTTYDRLQVGQASVAQEAARQQDYFAARSKVETAVKGIKARFGKTDAELLRAMEARRARLKGR